MSRLFNVDLITAELIKTTRSRFVQNILLYGLFSVVVIVFTFCVHSERALLRAPACLGPLNTAQFAVGMFMPALIGGWLTGHEASSDTWKTLLVRQPIRAPFVVAKVVAGVVVVGAACALAGVIAVLLFDVTGRALGVMPAPGTAEQVSLADLIVAVVHHASTGSVAFALGLLARTNSTAVGVTGGVVTQWVFNMLAGAGTNLTSTTHAARVLDAIDDGANASIVDVLGSIVVVCCWTIVPLVIAAFVFERRDLVSET